MSCLTFPDKRTSSIAILPWY